MEWKVVLCSTRSRKKCWVLFDLLEILQSAKKTKRVLIAHEAPLTGGFGAELAAAIQVRTRDAIVVKFRDFS
jgi:pyruvate/2-oxoglutarate/acetoin dehydrogenase E1 component